MKKKFLFALITFVLIFSCFALGESLPLQKTYAQEQEESVEVVSITDYDDLISISNNLSGEYKLEANIDLSQQENFLPIGLTVDSSNNITINAFTGEFDGNGYTITGLNFDTEKEFYNFGLFAHLSGASVINLKLENVNINGSVFASETLNSKTIVAGGLASVAQNSRIENVHVSFAEIEGNTALELAAGNVFFGGLLGRAESGTTIKNVIVEASANFKLFSHKLQNLNGGVLAGALDNALVSNVVTSGGFSLQVADEDVLHTSTLNLGGVAGQAFGKNLEIISTYSNISFNISYPISQSVFLGGLVGSLSNQAHTTPVANNLSYNVIIAKSGGQSMETVFGDKGLYVSTDSVYNFLERDNFEIFQHNESTQKYWSPFESKAWNTKQVWQIQSGRLPSLQVFSSYSVQLRIDKTKGVHAEGVLASQLLEMNFTDSDEIAENFAYGTYITVAIKPINDFHLFYKLESVEINGSTVISLGQEIEGYALEKIDTQQNNQGDKADTKDIDHTILPYPLPEFEDELGEGLEEQSGVTYYFSFYSNFFNSGEVSVTFSKINYYLEVSVQDALEGFVRRGEAINMREKSFVHQVSVANKYEFVAMPFDANFAFERWVLEFEDENAQVSQVDLGEVGSRARINVEFGKEDTTPISQGVIDGGRLVAIFTNNVTRITFLVEERDGEENPNAGQILLEDENQEYASSEVVSFIKGNEVVVVAKEKQGYKFVGWFDGQNRQRERNATLIYQTSVDEDDVTLIAVFERTGMAGKIPTLWLVLGITFAAGVIVVVVVVIRRKRKDYSYKNFY